jgi:hypothetical protein
VGTLKTVTGQAKKAQRLRALERQVQWVQNNLVALERASYRYSWIRIAVFVAGLLAIGAAFYFSGAWLAAICLAAFGLAFGLAVYGHRRVNYRVQCHQAWLRHKTAQMARASLDWAQIPAGFSQTARTDHPFEADLDLVGPRSVLRLVDTAVSYEGSQTLREWLVAPVPDPEQTLQRQAVVRELVPRTLFRDKLILNATLAMGAKRTWQAGHLLRWLAPQDSQNLQRRGPEFVLLGWLALFTALAVVNAGLLAANLAGLLPAWWELSLVIYLGLWLLRSRAMEAVWDDALAMQGAVSQLLAVFRQLETFSYRNAPHLKALCQPFLDRAHGPSRYLGRLTRTVAALGIRSNPVLGFVLNAIVPWDAYVAYHLSRVKAAMAGRAPAWLDAWFRLEALSSLANLAYLNPGYCFPAILAVDDPHPALVLRAEGLGHPLIPDGQKVSNDLLVPEMGRVAIITGSNMAGKSVFLKTVGVNMALASTGGPVDARLLQVLPFRLFSSMGIADSVTDGISFFYAEVKRLKWLLNELEGDHPLPLLFFIDEIFRGTNNRERLTGSRAYVRALAGKHGVGLIATHDLELARLADEVPHVDNYHFRDQVVGSRMVFDYMLRPGPCPTTNALKIMELEGLPVGDVQI